MPNYLTRIAAAGARTQQPARPPVAAPPLMPGPTPGLAMVASDSPAPLLGEEAGAFGAAYPPQVSSGASRDVDAPLSDAPPFDASTSAQESRLPRPAAETAETPHSAVRATQGEAQNRPQPIPAPDHSSEPAGPPQERAEPLAPGVRQEAAAPHTEASERQQHTQPPPLPEPLPPPPTRPASESSEVVRVPRSLRPAQQEDATPTRMPTPPDARFPTVSDARRPGSTNAAGERTEDARTGDGDTEDGRAKATVHPDSTALPVEQIGVEASQSAASPAPLPPAEGSSRLRPREQAPQEKTPVEPSAPSPGGAAPHLGSGPRRSRITIGRMEVQVHNEPPPLPPPPRPQPPQPVIPPMRENLAQSALERLGLERFWLRP